MSEYEFLQLKELCVIMKDFIKENKLYDFRFHYNNLLDIIDIIDSSLSNNKRLELVTERYKYLYPGHGGIDECYAYDNDFEKMKRINSVFKKAKNKAWNIMKEYIWNQYGNEVNYYLYLLHFSIVSNSISK